MALRPGLPRFCGGLAGYFGYDAVRYIEKRLADTAPPDDLHLPDILLLLCEEVAVIDNLAGKLYLIVYADPSRPEAYPRAKQRLRELKDKLRLTRSPRRAWRAASVRIRLRARVRQGRLPGGGGQGQGIHRRGRLHADRPSASASRSPTPTRP